MQFQGPDRDDLANVTALNRALIEALLAGSIEHGAAARLASELRSLGRPQRDRLAKCPFLLCSLAGHGGPDWQAAVADSRQRQLLSAQEPGFGARSRLIAATLGFLWQLARRNPYAVRLVTAAPLSWCETLAACTLLDLFDYGEHGVRTLSVIRSDDRRFWDKLLVAATGNDRVVRQAARVSALQSLLTASASEKLPRLPAAACAMTSPVSVRVSRGYNTRPDESPVDKKSPQDL
ncbi:MAG: hypothetical protein R3358_07490 [Woeseiaceae bacterium]|nr:hypothetical protein [Woeseiaceae bacterium]